MTKSDLFKTAHKIAKENRSCFADYRMAFSWALKETYKMTKENPFEIRFNEALKAAEAAADTVSVSDSCRGTYVVFAVCDALDCREIYSVSDLDCIRGKESKIFSLMLAIHQNKKEIAARKPHTPGTAKAARQAARWEAQDAGLAEMQAALQALIAE